MSSFFLGTSVITAAFGLLAAFAVAADHISAALAPWRILAWWQRVLRVAFWLVYIALLLGALHVVQRGSEALGFGPIFTGSNDD